MDSTAVLTKSLDAPEASCLYGEVHQDAFQVTEASLFVFLLQRDAVFLLGQSLGPFSSACFCRCCLLVCKCCKDQWTIEVLR